MKRIYISILVIFIITLSGCSVNTNYVTNMENIQQNKTNSMVIDNDSKENADKISDEELIVLYDAGNMFLERINYINWLNEKSSPIWELNELGNVRIILLQDKQGSYYALTKEGVNNNGMIKYYLLKIVKDKWGYADNMVVYMHESIDDVYNELSFMEYEELGEITIFIDEAYELPKGILNEKKIKILDEIEIYIRDALEKNDESGSFVLYFSDFKENETTFNVYIEKNGEVEWFGSYFIDTLETNLEVSSITGNSYEEYDKLYHESYFEKTKKIGFSRTFELGK
jgi:hypothetical protein